MTITNEWGLHARPAFTLAMTAMKFKSSVSLEKKGTLANIKEVTEILSLCAEKGDTLVLRADGEDEIEAVDTIARLMMSKFGELK